MCVCVCVSVCVGGVVVGRRGDQVWGHQGWTGLFILWPPATLRGAEPQT